MEKLKINKENLFDDRIIVYVSSFPKAISLLKEINLWKIATLIIPSLYKKDNPSCFEWEWQFINNFHGFWFEAMNPPIFLASKDKSKNFWKGSRLALLKALSQFDWIPKLDWVEIIYTQSNKESAEMVYNWGVDFCITNEMCLEEYWLQSISELQNKSPNFHFLYYNRLPIKKVKSQWLTISNTSITNNQARTFIDNFWYYSKQYWSEEWWNWKEKNEIYQPSYWWEKWYTDPDEPLTGISYYEAEAIAKFFWWRLPTEAEWKWIMWNWEKRTNYPWWNDYDENKIQWWMFENEDVE